MAEQPFDLTVPPDLAHKRQTGPTRTQRPIYVDLLPPCNHACPAGEDIQAWLASPPRASSGRRGRPYSRTTTARSARARVLPPLRVELQQGPPRRAGEHPRHRTLPRRQGAAGGVDAKNDRATHRQAGAHRGRRAERALGGPPPRAHGARGRDRGRADGGRHDAFRHPCRLPRDILDGEIERIERMGVNIVLDHKVEDLKAEIEDGGFHAAFVVGAHLSKRVDIPGRDAGKVLDALGFLKGVEMGETPKLGRRVAVYGGGNRHGRRPRRRAPRPTMVIYRRDKGTCRPTSSRLTKRSKRGSRSTGCAP